MASGTSVRHLTSDDDVIDQILAKITKHTILMYNKAEDDWITLSPHNVSMVAITVIRAGWLPEDITNVARTLELVFADDEYDILVIR